MTKTNPKDYVVQPGARAVESDLDAEIVRDRHGTRITEADAEAIADRVSTKVGRGRPSLSSTQQRSPQLGVRVSDTTYHRLQARAEHEGKKVSEIVREAIEHFV